MAKEWAAHTPKGKLPEKVGSTTKMANEGVVSEEISPATRSEIPMLAGLGTAAVAAPLAYRLFRKPTLSTSPYLRGIQEASKGRFARAIDQELPKTWLGRLKDKLLFDVDKLYYTDKYRQQPYPTKPKSFEGVVHHFDPGDIRAVRGTRNPSATRELKALSNIIGEHKWKEYEFFQKAAPGVMPSSKSVRDLLGELGIKDIPRDETSQTRVLQQLQQHLRETYPKGFVMKEVSGQQSAGAFPQETHDLPALLKQFRESGMPKRIPVGSEADLRETPGYAGRVLHGLMKNPSSALVQEKVPIERVTGARRLVGRAMGKPASKEIRVHVVAGQAIPGMAVPRYDPTMSVFEGKKLRGAEAYAQSIIDKLPEKYRRMEFGMDIAPIEGGGFRLIESNPGSQSGLLYPAGHPGLPFKLRKAMTGQWSPTVAGTGAAATALGTGGATYASTAPFVGGEKVAVAWLHERAEHLLAKNPSMKRETAFAIATQQSHSLGKTPKGYGTPEGKREAKAKYPTPKDDTKAANPGDLTTKKLSDEPTRVWRGDHFVEKKGEDESTGSRIRDIVESLYGKAKNIFHRSTRTVEKELEEAAEKGSRGKYLLGRALEAAPGQIKEIVPEPIKDYIHIKTASLLAFLDELEKESFQLSQYAGHTNEGYRPSPLVSGMPPLRKPPIEKKAGVGVGSGFTTSQYSGPLSLGSFKMVSGIPPFTSPGLARKQTTSAPEPWMEGINIKTSAALTPAGILAHSRGIGAPKISAPSGPSISQIAKPKGFGEALSGTTKNRAP